MVSGAESNPAGHLLWWSGIVASIYGATSTPLKLLHMPSSHVSASSLAEFPACQDGPLLYMHL